MPDNERRTRPFLTRLRDRLARRSALRFDRETDTLVHSPGGLQIREVPAAHVTRVEAGNRDNVGYETVFLFFHVDEQPMLAVAESDQGFAALVAALATRFPGIEGWEQAVPPVPYQLTSVNLWLRDTAEAATPTT